MSARRIAARTLLVGHPNADLYGSDRVLLESVSAMVDAGWRVVVAVPGPGPLVPLLLERGARVVECPSPVLRKSLLSPRGMLVFTRDVARDARRGLGLLRTVDPDLVWVNTVTIPLWIALARLRGIPVVAHVHEAEGSARRALRIALAAPLLAATAVVSNSRYSARVLGSVFPRLGRRAQVIYNGVPGPERMIPARLELTDGIRVAYIGRLSPRKGVDVAIEALCELEAQGIAARLDLIGAVFPGYEWYERELHERSVASGLSDRIVFHGFQDAVWDLIADCDVVVVPSRGDEPFGNTAVEAILAGRPVIASASSGLLEATAGYRSARTVPAGDAAALARAIAEVATDWQEQRSAAVTDAAEAQRRHGPITYRSQVAALIESMIGTAERPT